MAEQIRSHRGAAASNGLKPRESKLIRGLVEGKTTTQAALEAGYGKGVNGNAAAGYACEILRKPNVKEAYDAALSKAGLTVDATARKLVEASEADKLQSFGFKIKKVADWGTRLRAVELAGRFRGAIQSDAAEAAAGAVMALGFFIAKSRQMRGLPPIDGRLA